jgi:hypothetical protein
MLNVILPLCLNQKLKPTRILHCSKHSFTVLERNDKCVLTDISNTSTKYESRKSLIDNDVIGTTRNEDSVNKSVDQNHSWDPNWLSANWVVTTKVTVSIVKPR